MISLTIFSSLFIGKPSTQLLWSIIWLPADWYVHIIFLCHLSVLETSLSLLMKYPQKPLQRSLLITHSHTLQSTMCFEVPKPWNIIEIYGKETFLPMMWHCDWTIVGIVVHSHLTTNKITRLDTRFHPGFYPCSYVQVGHFCNLPYTKWSTNSSRI